MPDELNEISPGRFFAPATRSAARGDFLPGYEASSFFGFGAPKNAPAEIIDKLSRGDAVAQWFTIPEGYTVEQVADELAKNNLAEKHPEKVKELRGRYDAYARQAVEPKNKGDAAEE